ncbi:MAG: DUF423 domain-containing protein [Myxococcales bacterium]|nr:DUF423 domain-containing protein [Myxococcales bacterium]
MERFFLIAAGINGLLAVGLGAFGAHGLKARLANAADGAQRLGWWETASHYHLTHALALGLSAYLAQRTSTSAATVSGYAFLAGILLFSGSLYAMTLTNARVLGPITPLGGLCLLVGWAAIIAAATKL